VREPRRLPVSGLRLASALSEPVGELGQLGDIGQPVEAVGEVRALGLPANRSVLLLAHDVGVTSVTAELSDHVNDDPLQGHVLASQSPPRDRPRRVERQLRDRLVREGPDTVVEVDQPLSGLLLRGVPVGRGSSASASIETSSSGVGKSRPKVGPK
jgi:hypothetical protein